MDVIIGREAGASSPRLCIKLGDKTFFTGTPGSVPKSVSRSHCRLEVDGKGGMTISNVSDRNILFVNGLEYKTKTVSQSDLVELGAERYKLDLAEVLALLAKAPGKPQDTTKAYDISHLKRIWETYSDSKVQTQVQERKINNASSAMGILTSAGLICAFVPALAKIRVLTVSLTVVLGIVFFYIRSKRVNVPVEQKQLDDIFQDEYVCPHCKHFLGNQSYKLVLRNGGCPWCKSKFTEQHFVN